MDDSVKENALETVDMHALLTTNEGYKTFDLGQLYFMRPSINVGEIRQNVTSNYISSIMRTSKFERK